MIRKFFFALLTGAALFINGCSNSPSTTGQNSEKIPGNEYESGFTYLNASQYGVRYPETFILMQNRMGMRIEYCADRSVLQLWLSPQAGKSMSYTDRNWSNRDDHMNLFDRIRIPDENLKKFVKCDFDPFSSVIHFSDKNMHILNLCDQPAIVIWFDKDACVDFKSDMNDKAIERSDNRFIIHHPCRGREFEFAAIIGKGDGKFRQQIQIEDGRSIYARAELKANQPIVIAGELQKENIGNVAGKLAQTDLLKLQDENEARIAKALDFGRFHLKNRPEMQKLLDINRRIAFSMQDEKGFMRSTNQYIYYLLWFRDGGMDATHIAYTGWLTPARWQADFALHNSGISDENPEGLYYGQVMGGKINKWEEDGLFYVVWPAFSYWSMTGDNIFCKGEYMKTMEAAMDWLERQCYDKEKGMFGRYYYCETAMTGHRDNGWDNAVGRPENPYDSRYRDSIVTRSYDIYINSLLYSTYLMMSSMETGPKAEEYLHKAELLEKNILIFFNDKENLPDYGDLRTKAGKFINAGAYGMDNTDYQWSLSLPPFVPTLPQQYKIAREQLRTDLSGRTRHSFICSYATILSSMDNEIHNEDSIMASLDYLVPQSARPGKFLPMPYTIPEIVDMTDGDPYHDVRPLVYSIAPWLSAVSGLGVRKLPFGIAVRATKYLDHIDNFEYLGGLINFKFTGEGSIHKILVNGSDLKGTCQIPDNLIRKGANQVIIELSKETRAGDVLISSTVRLLSAEAGQYAFQAYGKNVLTFRNLSKKVYLRDEKGMELKTDIRRTDNLTYIEFKGRGRFSAELK